MGQTGSKVMRKLNSSLSFGGNLDSATSCDPEDQMAVLRRPGGRLPLVYSRRGSMFWDEDGDLAHEFYEERIAGGSECGCHRLQMQRVENVLLVPQGQVPYSHPRLHTDFPIILFEG